MIEFISLTDHYREGRGTVLIAIDKITSIHVIERGEENAYTLIKCGGDLIAVSESQEEVLDKINPKMSESDRQAMLKALHSLPINLK